MPYRTTSCQLAPTAASHSRLISPRTGDTPCLETPLVRGTASQHIDHTASRRSGPRKWLRAIQWLINAGLHPKANQTTRRVAEDLAARMDYSTGHALYGMEAMADRLDVDESTIRRHVAYLRELGALAWVQRGTRANIRRAKGEDGYAGTATVYAAVIPAVYDHAMGHRIIGGGYEARIVVDLRGQQNPVDNRPDGAVDNSGKGSCAPPSLTVVKEESQVQVVGGSNYTEQARPTKTPAPHHSSSINGRRRTATDVKNAGNETGLVRALVNWTQSVPLRKLEHALRPWTDRGWDGLRIADELNGMCSGVRWRPKNPVAFIRARITADTRQQEELAQAVAWEDSTAAKNLRSLAALFGPATPEPEPKAEYTAEDREYARLYGWDDWERVAAHLAEDQDDAIALYGEAICKFAIGKQALLERQGAWA